MQHNHRLPLNGEGGLERVLLLQQRHGLSKAVEGPSATPQVAGGRDALITISATGASACCSSSPGTCTSSCASTASGATT